MAKAVVRLKKPGDKVTGQKAIVKLKSPYKKPKPKKYTPSKRGYSKFA